MVGLAVVVGSAVVFGSDVVVKGANSSDAFVSVSVSVVSKSIVENIIVKKSVSVMVVPKVVVLILLVVVLGADEGVDIATLGGTVIIN